MASAKLQNIEPLLLEVNAACRKLSLCRSTLYEMMRDGAIAYVQVGGRRRIPSSEINRIVAEGAAARKLALL